MSGRALAAKVSTREPYVFSDTGRSRIAVVDYGCKRSIPNRLAWAGAAVTVYPHSVDADELAGYDGVLLERPRRPGTPPRGASNTEQFGRTGADSRDPPRLSAARPSQPGMMFKLPFGHRGSNHPVLERSTNRVLVTRRTTEGFAGRTERLQRGDAHLPLRRHRRRPGAERPARQVAPVPPRGGPGPHDAWGLIDRWVEEVSGALPKRHDIDSICLIGSGPIVIGQACEFDYAGCQALKVLREDGFKTIVVNSNPATIMTDPGFADRPISSRSTSRASRACSTGNGRMPCSRRWAARRRSTSLSTVGEEGILADLGVELIGAPDRGHQARRGPRAVPRDRARRGSPRAGVDHRHLARTSSRRTLSLPVILRPAFTLGGHGGGTARTPEELERLLERALAESPVGQVLVEESLLGWDEFELELMRDRADNAVVVCSIENLDPMGVTRATRVSKWPRR